MMMIGAIAQALAARDNCESSGNSPEIWDEVLDRIERELPRGSGIDSGTKIDRDSLPDCVFLEADFHHMDEHGFYDGWTEHRVSVRPSFVYGMSIHVHGRDRNGIKDYLAEVLRHALVQPVPEHCSFLAARQFLESK